MSVWDILTTYHQGFLGGLAVTLRLSLIVWTLGIGIGTLLGALSSHYRVGIGLPVRGIAFVLGGMPILVILFWLHYPVQAYFNVVIDPFITAAVTLTAVNIFAVSDLVNHAIKDFPQQYISAAKVCGLTPIKTFRHIQLPILFRSIFPGLLMLQVAMLHTTLFASLISVEEIFRVAQRINARIYQPIEIYTALGIFFLLVCLPVNGVAMWFKSRFTRNLSER